MKTKTRRVNPCNRLMDVGFAYAVWTDTISGWKYHLLKSWQANNLKPNARWHCFVEGWEREYGDCWTAELLPGLLHATDIEVDIFTFPNRENFLQWARGEQVA